MREVLPRIRRGDLAGELPGYDPAAPIEAFAALADAAAAAVARADLRSKAPDVMAARRAAVRVAIEAGLEPRIIRDLLGPGGTTLRRLRAGALYAGLCAPVRAQLALRRVRTEEPVVTGAALGALPRPAAAP